MEQYDFVPRCITKCERSSFFTGSDSDMGKIQGVLVRIPRTNLACAVCLNVTLSPLTIGASRI